MSQSQGFMNAMAYAQMSDEQRRAFLLRDQPWLKSYSDGTEYLEHVNGVHWFDAPKPWRWHRCRPQTRGFILGDFIERCACGGLRYDGHGPWIERNSRRNR